jgi:hypothetical protein
MIRDYLTAVNVGDSVRMRIGRRWYGGIVTRTGNGYGGVPVASVSVETSTKFARAFDERNELVSKLRPAKIER